MMRNQETFKRNKKSLIIMMIISIIIAIITTGHLSRGWWRSAKASEQTFCKLLPLERPSVASSQPIDSNHADHDFVFHIPTEIVFGEC